MIGIVGYGCQTAAGSGVQSLWSALHSGTEYAPVCWPEPRSGSSRQRLGAHLQSVYQQSLATAKGQDLGRMGVILGTTKGFVEDDVWQSETASPRDCIAPLLTDFLKASAQSFSCHAVLSNACTSALSALYLAQAWLDAKRVDSVLLLTIDEVGPFVTSGFKVLNALSQGVSRPFSESRDGLKLGEGAAAVLVSKRILGPVQVLGVALDAEGHAVTRPSPSGASLSRCLTHVPVGPPDVIVAHGTGTQLNDQVEDFVFAESYGRAPLVTGSKWCIGHTLAASGAIDLILACEILKRQDVFALGTTAQADPKFSSRYLTAGSRLDKRDIGKVLITSLGFGGVHAAAFLGRRV